MLHTWNNITGSHYNIQQNEKLHQFIESVFKKFDLKNNGEIYFDAFQEVIKKEPQILDIFDYFNKGIVDSIGPPTELDNVDKKVIEELEILHNRVTKLKDFLSNGMNENLETPKGNKPTSKSSINNTRTEMKYSKGSQIVHHLDSNIKRTIFFDPLRDESDYLSALHLGKT